MSQLVEAFYRHSRNTPEKRAVWCEGRALSYGELACLVGRCVEALSARGVTRGDHVGVLLPNGVDFIVLLLAAADIGAVLVPLNTSLPAAAVHRAFAAADVTHVVALEEIAVALRPEKELDFSFVRGWHPVPDPRWDAEKLAAGASLASSAAGSQAEEDDPFILTMTSGSTGDPKPIVLTQRTKFNRAMAAVELYGITAGDTILAATPLYHSLAERLVLLPLVTGGTSVLMSRFSPSEWLSCVREQEVTFTIAVSSQLKLIADQLSDDGGPDISTLRCVVSSSAQLDTPVKERLLEKLKCEFHECYGASEIAIASNLNASSDLEKLRSVGVAAPGVEIAILGEDGKLLPTGDAGEIICRTPMIFGGYYRRPDLTAESMWEGFFRTGDLGKLDADGYLYYLGRKKDLIITGAVNVYPTDVESVVAAFPSVAECAAFPLPDERLGEIVAVAVVAENKERFDLRKLRFWCADRLGDFQQPRKFFIVDELPKNNLGKIMKRLLPAHCCPDLEER